FKDERGFFFESYNKNLFVDSGIEFNVVQQNQSRSSYGTIRGLHFQSGNFPQAKFIRVIKGEILDVAVDLRSSSPTFGEYFAIKLSEENQKGLYIPYGFAHGFSALSKEVEVTYLCDEFYHADSEGGILYNDTDIAIDWLVDVSIANVSSKDKLQPSLQDYKLNPDFK
ncbi:dTDP-4-dehydrorhamnose 3,5-epimerase, partial [Vibrio penaeicida]